MKPGKELDALIAEKVMGLEVVRTEWKRKSGASGVYYTIGEPSWDDYAGDMQLGNAVPLYSEDISAAWEVVEKLDLLNGYTLGRYGFNGRWSVIDDSECAVVFGESAPHAICLAALKAIESKK